MSLRFWLRAGGGVLMLAVLLGGLALGWGYRELHRSWAGWDGESVDVVIPQGIAAGSMLERLAEAGVVRRPRLVRAWISWTGVADGLQAGEYRFSEPASALEVLQRLRAGDVLLHRLTLPEGLVLEEIARRFADAGFAPYDDLLEAFRDPVPVAEFDPRAEDLEGYLFPETYSFASGQDAQRIARTMVDSFLEASGPDYADRASRAGLTLREAVTLASMIEKETSVPDERARISAVFHNRLDRGMAMQCDPTVIYALHRAGRSVKRLSRADLAFESPWNTYVVKRLPPGPIANPGRASLLAAVEPIESQEMYFVASPEGGHRFSTDLAGHTRAVRVWRDYVRSSR